PDPHDPRRGLRAAGGCPAVSLRTRLTLASALAVALAIALASAFVYITVRAPQRNAIDDSLRSRRATLRSRGRPAIDPFTRSKSWVVDVPSFGGAGGYIQLVDARGETRRPTNEPVPLPVDAHTRAVALGTSDQYLSDVHVNGTHVRVITALLRPGV